MPSEQQGLGLFPKRGELRDERGLRFSRRFKA